MKVANLCRKLVNEIILDYDLMIPRLTTSSVIDKRVLLEVFQAVVPLDPLEGANGHSDETSVYHRMLTSLSQSLHIDLSHISPRSLAAGDTKHILAFLEILIAIKRFVLGTGQEDVHNATFTVERNCDTEERSSSPESASESCSICICHRVNETTTIVSDAEEKTKKNVKSDGDECSRRLRRRRSPHHRFVDARKKKKLLMTGNCSKLPSSRVQKSSSMSPAVATAGVSGGCTCSSHQLAQRLNQVLHFNEEVECLEKSVSTPSLLSSHCSSSVSPDLIVNSCILSPGTKIQLQRLLASHRAFQRNIQVQVEKVNDSRVLVSQQLLMHSKTGNVTTPAETGTNETHGEQQHQQQKQQMVKCCTHRSKRNTSILPSSVNPSLYMSSNYQRDLRSRLARLTHEMKERERQLTSAKLKTQDDLQRAIVKSTKSHIVRSKRELMAAREYVLDRNRQQMKRDQLYLQSLDKLFDERTRIICAQAERFS